MKIKKMFLLAGGLILLTMTLSACEQLDAISESKEYNQAKQAISSGTSYLKDKTTTFVENNEAAQKVVDKAGEVTDNLKDKAGELIEKGKKKVEKKVNEEVNKFKENIKNQVKSWVNKEIDKVFK